MGTIPETDWKYLRSVKSELLSSLCERINRKAMEILRSGDMAEHDKYKTLYQHMQHSDEIVAECFNDWRRSNILFKLIILRNNSLLTKEHIRHLSGETKDLLKSLPIE